MSTSAINPKGARVVPPGTGALNWTQTYLGSSVGQKILIGLTGAALVTFVIFHLIGNLKLFSGPESINKYGYFLKHDLGALIWIARAGLLGLFLAHLVLAIRLKMKAAAARPVGYVMQRSAQASPQSKTMIWTGIVILLFVLFHLAHFTFAWLHGVEVNGKYTNYLELKYTLENGQQVHDVYRMMIAGFSEPWIVALYLVAQLFLLVHLAHGIQSVFQTLGLVAKRFVPAVGMLGYAISGTIFLGNTLIVLAVWLKWVK
ncbi:MAG: succinate dehydrogenase cytochrome b subunit [Gemmataceae bacterium]